MIKKGLLLCFVAGLLWTGCAHRYVVVLTRGTTITTNKKPRLDKTSNCYVFKDLKGQQQVVPAASVREIAPASMSSDSTLAPLHTKSSH